MLMSNPPPITALPSTPGMANPYLQPGMPVGWPLTPVDDTTFTKIFVGGLPYHTTSKTLREHFEKFGDIKEAVVIMDKTTDKSKGYGFVTMAERRAADLAIKDTSPVIDGRKANVNLAYLGAKQKQPPTLDPSIYGQTIPSWLQSTLPIQMFRPTYYQPMPSTPTAAAAASYVGMSQYPAATQFTAAGIPLMTHQPTAHLSPAVPATMGAGNSVPYFDYNSMSLIHNPYSYPAAATGMTLEQYGVGTAAAVSAGTTPPPASAMYQGPAAVFGHTLPQSATAVPSAAAAVAASAATTPMAISYQSAAAGQPQLQETRMQ